MKQIAVLMLLACSSIARAEGEPVKIEGTTDQTESTLGVEVQLGGGSVIAWDGGSDTGNAFGGAVLVDVDDFALGLGAAVVLPDSRLQGQFGTYWVEGRWHFLGRNEMLQPYALVGIGLATGDEFVPNGTGFIPARWSTDTNVVGMLGAGARLGDTTGMYLTADVRAWNHTHLGLQLAVGYRFF